MIKNLLEVLCDNILPQLSVQESISLTKALIPSVNGITSKEMCIMHLALNINNLNYQEVIKKIENYSEEIKNINEIRLMLNDLSLNTVNDDLELQFKLHKFQYYLAKSSIAGKNSLICVRTGAGKTLIAAYICKYFFKQAQQNNNLSKFKVAFIVPTRPLVEQQYNVFMKAFDRDFLAKIEENHAEKEIQGYFRFSNVLFLTAKKLVNTVEKNFIPITDFSLLIFDECHHTDEKHPYSEIMNLYFKQSKNSLQKPQIVGLTASLGVGKKCNALDQLIKLCAHLDCKLVSSVNDAEMKENLMEKIASPNDDKIISVEPSPFKMSFLINARNCANKMLKTLLIDNFDMQIGDFEFESLVNSLKIQAERNNDLKLVIACKYLLEIHQLYLKIDDLDYEYCFKECLGFIKEQEDIESPTEDDIICLDHYKEFLSLMQKNPDIIKGNMKLDKLIDIVSKNNSINSRGLVLVKTRNHTVAIMDYINERLNSNGIRADRLTGKGSKTDYSMNDGDQLKVLQKFREGTINVLVATDIAQEGLDIPECNYVIRYEFVSNEIGTVQSRGRARAVKSSCYLITQSNSINENREYENRIKEKMMDEALDEWMNYDQDTFEKKFNEFQQKLLYIHANRSEQLKSKDLIKFDNNGIQVLCRNCSQFICNANEIQHRDPNYVTLSNLNITPDRMKHVFNCSNSSCSKELGKIIVFAKGKVREAFNLQIKLIKFKNINEFQSNVYNQWSKVPYEFEKANF